MRDPKCQKEYPDFVAGVESLTSDQLKARVVQLQQFLEESEAAKENDDALKQARAQLTEYGAPYRDVKKAVKIKTKYLIELLSEKGE